MDYRQLPRPLLKIVATVLVCAAAMLVQVVPSPQIIRLAVVLPLLGFIPGYAVLSALFPSRLSLRTSFRGVLALLLSLCIVPAVATVLDRTPWGIRPLPLILILMALSLGAEMIGWWQERRIQSKSGDTAIGSELQSSVKLPGARTKAQWAAGMLFVAVIATGIYWTLLAPPTARPYTELYLEPELVTVLSQPGQEPAMIPFTVVNHENQDLEYRVEVIVDGIPNQVAGPVSIKDGGQWQTTVIVPRVVNADQRVELNLFRNEDRTPHRAIHLWIGPLESR